MRIVKLTEKTRENILSGLLKRNPSQYSEYEGTVREILDKVRTEGDKAVFEYTLKFDKCELTPENVRVTQAEIDEAFDPIRNQLHMTIHLQRMDIFDAMHRI